MYSSILLPLHLFGIFERLQRDRERFAWAKTSEIQMLEYAHIQGVTVEFSVLLSITMLTIENNLQRVFLIRFAGMIPSRRVFSRSTTNSL